ncbi:MAG: 50S ribosomal protein L9 [Gemmatimonadota bacterium]|jgi:large subunit ribosomal protein L9|nr:MAG: 50S ribosomal protein L9 [Gemmatimonadota bacterium]
MTRVILRQDVTDLGRAGEIVDVKAGYARNYLIPQGLAYAASEGNVRRLENERRQARVSVEREKERAEGLAAELEGRSVSFKVRAGEEGRLFGSVTSVDIAEQLARDGVVIDRRDIMLDEPIKELGVFRVPVRLHADVRPELTVWVVAEE